MTSLAINEWWEVMTTAQKVFWIIALSFSVLFVIQFVMSLIGLDADSDVDVDASVDMEADFDSADVDHGYDIDPSFTILSIRGVIAFFTFFGWTGVWILHKGWGLMPAIGIALASGLAAMTVVAYMIFQFARLEKSGTSNITHALQEEGEVYLTIPAAGHGTGKIHIRLDGVLREFDALTDGKSISTGERIKVVDIMEDNVLIVKPLAALKEGYAEEN